MLDDELVNALRLHAEDVRRLGGRYEIGQRRVLELLGEQVLADRLDPHGGPPGHPGLGRPGLDHGRGRVGRLAGAAGQDRDDGVPRARAGRDDAVAVLEHVHQIIGSIVVRQGIAGIPGRAALHADAERLHDAHCSPVSSSFLFMFLPGGQ